MRKIIGSGFLLAACLVAAPAHAATLSESQIQAIISLLASFGADARVLTNTSAVLHGQSSGSALGSATVSSGSSATVSQSSVTASSNRFTLKGTASGANSVFVALVKSSYNGPTDWTTIYNNRSYAAFTGDTITRVRGGKWSVRFSGVQSGSYRVLVYSNDNASQTLLGSSLLSVSGPGMLRYSANSNSTLTLGAGQLATDSGLQITLLSVSYTNGNFGTPMAHFQVDIKGYATSYYDATIGGMVSNGGGLSDPAAPCGGIGITVSAISISMNTATITINPVCKG